VVNLSCT